MSPCAGEAEMDRADQTIHLRIFGPDVAKRTVTENSMPCFALLQLKKANLILLIEKYEVK